MADRIATFITPGKDIARAVERAQLAEELGYDLVLTTHIAARDGLMSLAAYAAGTSRIGLGTGVLPAFPRHPVATAIEAATLDEISGGRLTLGLGTAHAITMQNWYGFEYAKPFTQFTEYVHIVREIIRTGRCEFAGEFYRVNYAFMGYAARADLPIYTASLGPKSLRWAGANADGIILWGCLPAYIRDAVVPGITEGATEAGRDPAEVDIVAAIPCAVTDDLDAGRAALRRDFFVYMTLPFYRRAIDGAGYGDELNAFDAALGAGDSEGARAAISDRMIAEFAGLGTPEAVRAKLDDYRSAGVTTPGVGFVSLPKEAGPGVEETMAAAVGKA